MSMPPSGPGQPGPYGQGQQPPFGQQPHPGQQVPYGQQAPYGQQPQGGYPYGAPGSPGGTPPSKGGVPVWAWIVGGIAAVVLLCLCGGIGVYALSGDDESTTAASTSTTPTTQPTTEPTTEPTTTEPPTTTTTSVPTTTTTTTASPTQSVPPTPAGSTPNTNTSRTISADEVESQIARGMSQYGHKKSDISCPSSLVLVEGRKAFCTAPVPGSSTRRSTVTVEVAWAANTSSSDTRYYLTFRQPLR